MCRIVPNAAFIEKEDGRMKDKRDNYQNILLLGCDVAPDVENPTEKEQCMRSDVMLVVSLNRSTGRAKLLTLMRDIWVDIPGYGKGKLNAPVVYGGPELAMNVVNDSFRLNIKKYIMISMGNMVDLIDSLGGIDLYLSDEEAAFVNFGIPAAKADIKRDYDVAPLKTGGLCHMCGLQAVEHMRNRFFGSREKRTHDVLKSLLYKVKSEYNFLGMMVIAIRALKYVNTNIGIPEILRLLPFYRKIKLREVKPYLVPEEGTFEVKCDGTWRMEVDFAKAAEKMWDFLSSD